MSQGHYFDDLFKPRYNTTGFSVEKSLINDGLCHVDRDMKVTDIYINKDWSLLWEANSKVLKSFKWGTEEKTSPAAMEKKKRMTSKQIILSRPAFSASRRLQSTA